MIHCYICIFLSLNYSFLRSHYGAQVALKFAILFSQLLECWAISGNSVLLDSTGTIPISVL